MALIPGSELKAPTGSFSPVLRLLNVYFNSQDATAQKLRSLQTILLYLLNIVKDPDNVKFRTIRIRNVKFAKDVLPCAGAESLLLAIGFNKTVKDFEEFLVLSPGADITTDYFRVKRVKETMEEAMAQSMDAPANRIRAEREAKEAAIRQIEEDKRMRKAKLERVRISTNTLPQGQELHDQTARQRAALAAQRRLQALEAPIIAATSMLPTPSLSHLTESDYDHIYEPAEDSFALLDALQNDVTLIKSTSQVPLVLEIGPGTGIVSTFIQQSILPSSLHLCSDINEIACQKTLQTSQINITSNATSLDVVRASLLAGLRMHSVDLLVFNPPYVPTESREIDYEGTIDAAWAGGADGMDVTAVLIAQAANILSTSGLFYLVAVARNHPLKIIDRASSMGLTGRIVLERRAGREKLSIIRFHKSPSATAPEISGGGEVAAILSETRRIDGQDPSLREDPSNVGTLD